MGVEVGVEVEQVADARTFLEVTHALRAAEPLLTNVLSSIAQSVVAGRRYDAVGWWVVRGPAGEPVGCAVRTAPHHAQVSPMPPDAAAALGHRLAGADPGLPGISGTRAAAHAAAAAFVAARPDVRVETRMTDVLHVLGDLVPPPAVPGGPRDAVPSELGVLVAWHDQFASDAGLPVRSTAEAVAARLAQSGFWWWVADGERVSLAGHAPLVESPAGLVGRVGPVFTPARFRRRGYGAAVTAAVVEHLVPLCATVMLYADAANATSNGVYERLGFRRVAEVVELDLLPAS